MSDTVHRFIFDDYGIRGEVTNLTESSQKMIQAHQYPTFISDLLQQAAAVNVLLATTLKFEGRISIQLQSQSSLRMLVVQTSHQLGFRGMAQFDEQADYSKMTFKDLTKDGQMCITIEPLKGKRYQGIVSLDGENLAQCVENYFNQSEQLKTRIWLFNNQQQVFGLLLQALPDMDSEASFQHLTHLASTLTEQECLSVDSETILHRLFHQEAINNLSVDNIEFSCGCSREKMLDSLMLLGEEEISQILAEEGQISMNCEFCRNHYSFTDLDIKKHHSLEGNSTQH
ncbi:MAG: Hsp33 family molecular chaperone HslO [Gammaproteobacteria bacterium]|nr:MAG: Hsp33 family molecular chaperone HslO [Gammaproteobacteria bacterium]